MPQSLSIRDSKDNKEETIQFLSYSGGTNASSKSLFDFAQDELNVLINGTIRNGNICQRDKFIVKPIYSNATLLDEFERGIWQGGIFFDNWKYNDKWINVSGGNIYAIDIDSGSIEKINPVGFENKPYFSTETSIVHAEIRVDFLVLKEGKKEPVYLHKDDRIFTIDKEVKGLKIGTVMADGWGRLFQLNSTGTRIYVTNHEGDPVNTNPLRDDDVIYYLNLPYIPVPTHIGEGVALEFVPFPTATGIGQLIVFGTKGVLSLNVSVPRENWINTDIVRTELRNIGSLSPKGHESYNRDIFFLSNEGRITSLRFANKDEERANVVQIDKKIYPLYKDTPKELLPYADMVVFNNRLLTTVKPEGYYDEELKQWRVRHKGIAVLNFETTKDTIAWDGVWTGLNTVGFIKDKVTDRLVIVSTDPDNRNRIYEVSKEDLDYDFAPESGIKNGLGDKAVETIAVMRPTNFRDTARTKRITDSSLTVTDINGDLTIDAYGIFNGRDKLMHNLGKHCISVNKNQDTRFNSSGRITQPVEGQIDRLPLVDIKEIAEGAEEDTCLKQQIFKSLKPVIVYKGSACLSELVFDVIIDCETEKTMPNCCEKPEIQSNRLQLDFDFYRYSTYNEEIID